MLSETIFYRLMQWPKAGRYWIAFSGGADSQSLLSALVEMRRSHSIEISAVHVDHQISSLSKDWVKHCRWVCQRLRVPLMVKKVSLESLGNVEEEARRLRYRAIESIMSEGDIVLTAHTAEDQAETVLLQMLRGSGPAGLAAMPELKRFGLGWHGRPMLNIPRKHVREYVQGSNVVDDPSNEDVAYDRNFLRNNVYPMLRDRWPGVTKTLTRVAKLQAENRRLLYYLASVDLKVCGTDRNTLRIKELLALDQPRRLNVIRYWIEKNKLRAMTRAQLISVHDLIIAADASRGVVTWNHESIRCYDGHLHIVGQLNPVGVESGRQWKLEYTAGLAHGCLCAFRTVAGGLAADLESAEIAIRYRLGGERCRPSYRGHSQTLKKLFQEAKVPPWWRSRIPLLYIRDELAAVGSLWVCAPFYAPPGEPAWQISWTDVADKSLQSQKEIACSAEDFVSPKDD